jgi:hypothetical protein
MSADLRPVFQKPAIAETPATVGAERPPLVLRMPEKPLVPAGGRRPETHAEHILRRSDERKAKAAALLADPVSEEELARVAALTDAGRAAWLRAHPAWAIKVARMVHKHRRQDRARAQQEAYDSAALKKAKRQAAKIARAEARAVEGRLNEVDGLDHMMRRVPRIEGF